MDKLTCRLYRLVFLGKIEGFNIFYYPVTDKFYRGEKQTESSGSMMAGMFMGLGLVAIIRAMIPKVFLSSGIVFLVLCLSAATVLFFIIKFFRRLMPLYEIELSPEELTALSKNDGLSRRILLVIVVLGYFILTLIGLNFVFEAPLMGVISVGVLLGISPLMIYALWSTGRKIMLFS